MKKMLYGLIALVLLVVLQLPVLATVTYQGTGTKTGKAEYFNSYVSAAKTDTTSPINGKLIDNRDGAVKNISAMFKATDQAGSSPTLTMTLQGSNDAVNWFTVQSADATPVDIKTSAVDVSTASSTTVVTGLSTCSELRCDGGFPAFLRLQYTIGGTGTPGVTFVSSMIVTRGN